MKFDFDKTIFDSTSNPLDRTLIMKGVGQLFDDNVNILPPIWIDLGTDRAKNLAHFFKKIREIPEIEELILDLSNEFKMIESDGAKKFADILLRYAEKQDKILSLVKNESEF